MNTAAPSIYCSWRAKEIPCALWCFVRLRANKLNSCVLAKLFCSAYCFISIREFHLCIAEHNTESPMRQSTLNNIEFYCAVFSSTQSNIENIYFISELCIHRIYFSSDAIPTADPRKTSKPLVCLSGERPIQNHHRHCAKGRPDRTTHHHPKRCRHGGYIVC